MDRSHRLLRPAGPWDTLSAHKKAAGILEIGCGNGWLSHQLSGVPGSRVIGLDPNLGELRQAARIFRKQPNLKFIYGDFYSAVLQDLSFDIIVMAANLIHCFPSLPAIVKDALTHLRPRGELHILDSCFYRPALRDVPHHYLYDPRSFWKPDNQQTRKPSLGFCITAPHNTPMPITKKSLILSPVVNTCNSGKHE